MMAPSRISILLQFLFWLQLLSTAAAAAANAYDALISHGLPAGLLPNGVVEFAVGSDGKFEVKLEAPCTARPESDTGVRYETNITGNLLEGKIEDLSGVSAQDLFLWLPVQSIRVPDPSSGVIFFDVGGVRKQFSLSSFEYPPECIPELQQNLRVDLVGMKDVRSIAAA